MRRFSKKHFKKIEDALGFKLHKWQKEYIKMDPDYMPDDRACGKTTAFILRHLLNYEVRIPFIRDVFYDNFPCDIEDSKIYKDRLYINYVYDIARMLNNAGICTIFSTVCIYCEIDDNCGYGVRISDYEYIAHDGVCPVIRRYYKNYFLVEGSVQCEIRNCPWCGRQLRKYDRIDYEMKERKKIYKYE